MPASEARSPLEMWILAPMILCSWTLRKHKECQKKNIQNYWQLASASAVRTLDIDTGTVQKGLNARTRTEKEPQSHDPNLRHEQQTPLHLLKKCLVRRKKKKKPA